MSWILLPEYWDKTEFILIRDFVLKKALNLDPNKTLFSPKALFQNKTFVQEAEELRVRRENKEPLDDYFKSVQKLENRLLFYKAFQRGDIPAWIPAGDGSSWRSFSESKEEQELFQEIIKTYVSAVSAQEKSPPSARQKKRELEKSVEAFKQKLMEKYPEYEKHLSKVSVELHYNFLNPFRLAWVFYLLGLLFLFLNFLFHKKYLFYGSLAVLALAFCTQGYGMALRSFIMSRPPVTNMYETVVWVPWVSVILGTFLWWRHKAFFVFVCSCVVALFCLLLVDSAPTLLDGRLDPLEAVLRSNFWLITHVLVITMSYAAFFLAFAMGDVLLFLFLKNKKTGVERDKLLLYTRCIDRCLQTGVVLLAGGTILGGIWADYSWGRFWGWDPKETWALISLLAYLALLHGRLVGWIKEFGLAVGSVLVFFLIVMAWYGVNYVLGQGLHSYGFGSGGVEYVSGFALLHLIYVLFVWTLCRFRS